MTSDPIIVSVPHSGTRFLKKRLDVRDNAHTTLPWGRLWEWCSMEREIIVPLREPADVFRSWCRRNNPKSFPYGEFFMAWGQLHALDQMIELDVICVDQCSDPRITDWTQEGHGDGAYAGWKLHKADLRPVYKLPIVERHYH